MYPIFNKLLVTNNSIFKPLELYLTTFIIFIFGVVAIYALFLDTINEFYYLSMALLSVQVFRVISEFKVYGFFGKPIVTISDTAIFLTKPINYKLSISIDELEKVIVYGPVNHRKYSFLLKSGGGVDFAPSFKPNVQINFINVLQRNLPPRIDIEIKEPPTLLDGFRGYEP